MEVQPDTFLNSVFESASSPALRTPRERAPSTHYIWDCAGFRAGMNVLEKQWGIERCLLCCPTRSLVPVRNALPQLHFYTTIMHKVDTFTPDAALKTKSHK